MVIGYVLILPDKTVHASIARDRPSASPTAGHSAIEWLLTVVQ